MQIPQNIINMLSAKGKGYIEAAIKIAEGQRLVDEGTLEIATLDGKNFKASKGSNGHHPHAGGIDVLAGVRDLAKPKITPEGIRALLVDGNKSTRELAVLIGRSIKHTREIVAGIEGVVNVGSGNKMRWALRTVTSTSRINKRPTLMNKMLRRPKDTTGFGEQAPRCKMALEAIQKDAWMNTSRVSKQVLGSHETAVEVCAMLEKAGMIKRVEKANNPSHTGQAFHRSLEYWEADPKARIDVVNMHVSRMPVKDPTTMYPAIEQAIKAANGWANKRVLEAATGLSMGVLNRVLKAMSKDKLIKTVWKKHNPVHKQPKNFERDAEYWEMVGGA